MMSDPLTEAQISKRILKLACSHTGVQPSWYRPEIQFQLLGPFGATIRRGNRLRSCRNSSKAGRGWRQLLSWN